MTTASFIHKNRHFLSVLLVITLLAVPMRLKGECPDCDGCNFNLAIRTNLLHDALLTPDLGVEVSLGRHVSVMAEGVWAWWSRSERHRYWRIYGGRLEMRYWFGGKNAVQALTGHHIGVYGSLHSYDFEFGHKGWQAPQMAGVGLSYGYSIRLNDHLNMDFGLSAGYSFGKQKEYIPQCNTYVATSYGTRRYFGLTGLEVALVWFPGSQNRNIVRGL